MILVADTNIVFSILLKKDSKEWEIFLREDTEVFIPKFLMVELFRHKEKIIRLSGLEEKEILELLYLVLRYSSVFDEEDITDDIKKRAFELIKDIDEKDAVFVASAMSLNAKLWSGDKKLAAGLESKGIDSGNPVRRNPSAGNCQKFRLDMEKTVTADTGFIAALLNRSDARHETVVPFYLQYRRILLPQTVLAETAYLVGQSAGISTVAEFQPFPPCRPDRSKCETHS